MRDPLKLLYLECFVLQHLCTYVILKIYLQIQLGKHIGSVDALHVLQISLNKLTVFIKSGLYYFYKMHKIIPELYSRAPVGLVEWKGVFCKFTSATSVVSLIAYCRIASNSSTSLTIVKAIRRTISFAEGVSPIQFPNIISLYGAVLADSQLSLCRCV